MISVSFSHQESPIDSICLGGGGIFKNQAAILRIDSISEDIEKAPRSTEERYDGLTQQDLIELAADGDEDADRELQERAADRDY